jgi:hypothetical protein
MAFKKHPELEGLHAPFSPSKSSWLRYDDSKAITVLKNMRAAARGTKLHEWAKMTIELGIKQPDNGKTLSVYVNDAIGFKMKPEVVLYHSPRFFGTADTICFRDGVLRIHDLKTGEKPASIEQLEIYAALFCLEYKKRPGELKGIELRIYQNNGIVVHNPTVEDIAHIMDKIVHLDKIIEQNLLLEEV